MKFKTFIKSLNEVMLTFGKKTHPKFGQVIILSGGSGCFDKGTLVQTDNGHKPIQDIKLQDNVLSYNEATKTKEFKKVTNTFIHNKTKKMVKLTFDNGEVIRCTEDHKFFIDGEYIQAKDIKID